MRVGTLFVVISFFCFFLSINFGVLLQYLVVDELLKAQLLSLTTSFFIGGIVMIVLFAVVKFSGRLFSEKETRP